MKARMFNKPSAPLILQHSHFPSHSDDFHLGVGVDGDNIVALRRLDARFGVGLTVKIFLNEEVASLFEVDAAVIAHEAVRVVQLVSGLHYGATKRTNDWDEIRQFDAARLMRYVFSFSQYHSCILSGKKGRHLHHSWIHSQLWRKHGRRERWVMRDGCLISLLHVQCESLS